MKTLAIGSLLAVAGCSQLGNNANSLGVLWVGPGTSATLTINAQTTTVPAGVTPASTIPVTVLTKVLP